MVEPLVRRPAGPPSGLPTAEPRQGLGDANPIGDVVAEVPERRHDLVLDEDSSPVEARQPTAHTHAEAAQCGKPATGAIEGMRTEVQVEAVAAAGAGPPAEVLPGFEDGDVPAGTSERGGCREPGEAPADDDGPRGAWFMHTTQTNDGRLL